MKYKKVNEQYIDEYCGDEEYCVGYTLSLEFSELDTDTEDYKSALRKEMDLSVRTVIDRYEHDYELDAEGYATFHIKWPGIRREL